MEDLEDKEDFEEFEIRQKSEEAAKKLQEQKFDRDLENYDNDGEDDNDDDHHHHRGGHRFLDNSRDEEDYEEGDEYDDEIERA